MNKKHYSVSEGDAIPSNIDLDGSIIKKFVPTPVSHTCKFCHSDVREEPTTLFVGTENEGHNHLQDILKELKVCGSCHSQLINGFSEEEVMETMKTWRDQ